MQELDSKLIEAFITFPYSAGIMLHVASKMKSDFLECGAGFPILLLHGLPANGKTSTIKACLTDTDDDIKFAEGLKSVKELMDEMSGEQTVLLDNYPRFLSHYKREKSLRILDYVIDVVSEDPKKPSVIITAEPNILEDLQKAESLRARMLLIPVPEISADEGLYSIRDYLTRNRESYLNIIVDFDRWWNKNQISQDDLKKFLTAFREKNNQYSIRLTGLVFTYYYANNIFSKFLEEVYGRGIARAAIEENVQQLFRWKETEYQMKTSITTEVWNMLITNENAFELTELHSNICKYLLNGTWCSKEYDCRNCYEGCYVELYNPMELMINSRKSNHAVLIENPNLIPGFPKYIKCDDPLLMVESRTLFKMMNLCLEEYSRIKHISVMPFSPKKMHKDFFVNNLCLFEYVGSNHNSYTFPMIDTDGASIRVMFLKLKKEQYSFLKKRVSKIPALFSYEKESVRKMNRCIKNIGASVQSLFGEVGTPSRIIER